MLRKKQVIVKSTINNEYLVMKIFFIGCKRKKRRLVWRKRAKRQKKRTRKKNRKDLTFLLANERMDVSPFFISAGEGEDWFWKAPQAAWTRGDNTATLRFKNWKPMVFQRCKILIELSRTKKTRNLRVDCYSFSMKSSLTNNTSNKSAEQSSNERSRAITDKWIIKHRRRSLFRLYDIWAER